MEPFRYHPGQREVQREANSVPVADNLSTWVGPVIDFARQADLVVLASAAPPEDLVLAALSGPAPLVEARETDGGIVVRFPPALLEIVEAERLCGGIVIHLARARRSRVGGRLRRTAEGAELSCQVAFTNCRKYMAPSLPVGEGLRIGPIRSEALALDDPWVRRTVARAETAFLATRTPDGLPDVSHRGGPPGFLRLDEASTAIQWTEYLGDGMFVSAGNVRHGRRFTLIVLDLGSGDALRLDATGDYTNLRADRKARVDALLQANEPFPVQGAMRGEVRAASRLVGFCHPRERLLRQERITSTCTTREQHP
jgi:hypothetical protein